MSDSKGDTNVCIYLYMDTHIFLYHGRKKKNYRDKKQIKLVTARGWK